MLRALTMPSQPITRIEEILWPQGERRDIWMIADGARDRSVYSSLMSSYLTYSCLYAGDLAPALEVAAPHLVQLEHNDRYTRRILANGWGNNWGVFLRCDLNMQQLRRHLRHFLIASDTRGRRLVFRFYDPRVLRVYLPTCFTDELAALFGPIRYFWTESRVPGRMLEFSLQRGKLVERELVLGAEPLPPRPAGDGPFLGKVPQRYNPLLIRQAQLNAFAQAERLKFEDWMVAHLTKFFPKQCESAGEAGLRDTIQYGIRRAAAHGITTRRDTCKYIDLMIVFGPDFDTDRRLGWAGKILRQRAGSGVKMPSLLAAAKRHLAKR